MTAVGGNLTGTIQTKTAVRNAIGESIPVWTDKHTLTGFLDLSSGASGGSAGYVHFNAKIEESTHIFICDYQKLDVKAEESRMLINGEIYDIQLIDNPMHLNYQLEIYLKFVGGQNGSA